MKTKRRVKRPLSASLPEGTPELDACAATVLAGILERTLEYDFESLPSECYGLSELLRHHPALRRESLALRSIADADEVLTRFINSTIHIPTQLQNA